MPGSSGKVSASHGNGNIIAAKRIAPGPEVKLSAATKEEAIAKILEDESTGADLGTEVVRYPAVELQRNDFG